MCFGGQSLSGIALAGHSCRHAMSSYDVPCLTVVPYARRLARGLHEPNLDTWRPRVNGVQLKALQASAFPVFNMPSS